MRAMSAACLVCLLAACGQTAAPPPAGKGPGAPGAPAMPPAEVAVVTMTPESMALVVDLPGRLEALRSAQVRARVAGIVVSRQFREGSDVRQGEVLYRIDPTAFQATVDSASAVLAKAQATLMQATATAERYEPLVRANAISQQDYTNAVAARKQAEADVAAGTAALQTARINLGYATVTAPIAGRIGRALVTEGALVGQGDATPMAMIQQVDPLYVNFTQPVADVLRLRKSIGSGSLKAADASQAATVRVLLDDGSPYPQPGKLLFSDLSVDQSSGQVTLRAQLPNPQGLLLPGMYVRVRIEQGRNDTALPVPQQAVTRNAQGDTVLVVDDKGGVSPRPVKIAMGQGNRWVVTEGLKPGEQVIVEGFQKLRPGAPVKAVPWQPRAPEPRQIPGPKPRANPPPEAAGKSAVPEAAGKSAVPEAAGKSAVPEAAAKSAAPAAAGK
jgi:membrane fusion protein (multidrug efflux system)